MAENTKNESKEAALAKASKMNTIKSFFPVLGLILLFVVFNIATGGGMVSAWDTLITMIFPVMISSVGVFFIMTMGGLDFSQGSIIGMASIAICYVSNYSIPLAIISGIAMGAAIGAINGFFYVKRKIKSFIVTICTMFLFRGIIKYLTSKNPVNASMMKMQAFNTLAFKLTCTVIILAVAFIIFTFTKFGTYLKAIGAGEKAAMFAGIKTDKMKFWIYVLSGAITGFAAFILSVKNLSAQANCGERLETQILISLVLGGMPISGGAKVRFMNVIVGSLLYVVLEKGLLMIGLTTQMMQLIEGIIFLIFVAIFADRKSLKVIK